MRIQKDQIVKTAIAILDRDGLEGVTLRRLAKELGVQAPAIYWHIPNKQALLDEMANAILDERFEVLDFSDDQRNWAAWLARMASELRLAMLAHREAARIVAGAHLNVALTLTRLIDLNLRVLHNAGFSYIDASRISTTVMTFTFGFVIEEQSPAPLVETFVFPTVEHKPFADFPGIAGLLESPAQEFFDSEGRFDACLSFIISGARVELMPSDENSQER